MPDPHDPHRIGDAEVQALRAATSPRQLRAAAEAVSGDENTLLRDLADALESQDPAGTLQAIVDRVLGSRPSNPEQAREVVAQILGRYPPLLEQLAEAVPPAGTIEGFAEAQADFRDQANAAENLGDADLAEAFRALADPDLLGPLGDVLAGTRRVVDAIRDVTGRAAAGRPADVQALKRISADLQKLKARATQVDPAKRVDSVLSVLRQRLEAVNDPRAADLTLMLAVTRQQEREAAGQDGVDPLFERALALAEQHGNLVVAQEAVRVLQADALEHGDPARVAALARRVIPVADASGENRPRVLSRLENALATARAGKPARGYDLAEQAQRLADELAIPELIGRSLLVKAQILEQTGERTRAASVFRDVASSLAGIDDPGALDVVAQAFLGIGRCASSGAESLSAWKQAQRLGLQQRDALPFIYGSLGIVEHYVDVDDRPTAIEALVSFRAMTLRMGGPDGPRLVQPFEELAARIQHQWGKPAYDAEIAAYCERTGAKMPGQS